MRKIADLVTDLINELLDCRRSRAPALAKVKALVLRRLQAGRNGRADQIVELNEGGNVFRAPFR
jgi:hypothetical protein